MARPKASSGGPRRDSAVTRAINRRQVVLLQDRLASLGLSNPRDDLVALLNDCRQSADIFTTTREASRTRSVQNWLQRTGAPRPVFQALAECDPAEPDLVYRFDLLERLKDPDLATKPTTLALNLALNLDRGLDNPPPPADQGLPEDRRSTTDPLEIVQWATYLLNAAAAEERSGTIVIDAHGFEAIGDNVGVAATDAHEWRQALWRALRSGWRVRHVLSWAPQQTPQLSDSVQAELVVNLLYAAAEAGGGGRYEPIICSPLPSANVVAAQDIGALAMWRRPHKQPRYALRVDGPDGLAAFTTGPSAVGLRFAVPTITFTDDPYSRLRFDMALAAAELDPEAQHCMVKGGLPTALVDAETAELQESRWREAVPHEAPYIELHHEVRERRRRAFKNLTSSRSAAGGYRDIITTEGVLSYIENGDPGGGAFGGRYLGLDERIAQTHKLADVVESRPKYELALVERRELLVPVDKNWWAAVRGLERDSRGVFFVASRRQDHDQVQERQGWLSDSGSTNTVDAFFALFQLMWDILPAETKDAHAVAARLRSLAGQAKSDSR